MRTQRFAHRFGSQVIGCVLAAVFIAAAGPQPQGGVAEPDAGAGQPQPVPVWALDGTHNRVVLASAGKAATR